MIHRMKFFLKCFSTKPMQVGRMYQLFPVSTTFLFPKAVKAAIGKFMTLDREVYAASNDKCSLFVGHDNTFALLAHAERSSTVRVYVRDICKGIENIETGECYNEVIALPKPGRWFGGCTIMPEADEYAIDLPLAQGKISFFRVIR